VSTIPRTPSRAWSAGAWWRGPGAPSHVAAVRRLVFDSLDPDDVAALTTIVEKLLARLDVALVYSSDLSSYLTGTVAEVTGGRYM
jgi:hypothetical protein